MLAFCAFRSTTRAVNFIAVCSLFSSSQCSGHVSATLAECCALFLHLRVFWFFISEILIFLLPPPLLPFFPLLMQCDGCLDVSVWGLMAGLWGLLAMGVFHCLGTGDHIGGPWTSQIPTVHTAE